MSNTEDHMSSPAVQTLQLGLSGLHCSGCSNRVRQSLEALPGVHSVQVADDRMSCRIELEAAPADPQAFVSAVEALGFGASLS